MENLSIILNTLSLQSNISLNKHLLSELKDLNAVAYLSFLIDIFQTAVDNNTIAIMDEDIYFECSRQHIESQLYLSPHLQRKCEEILINNKLIVIKKLDMPARSYYSINFDEIALKLSVHRCRQNFSQQEIKIFNNKRLKNLTTTNDENVENNFDNTQIIENSAVTKSNETKVINNPPFRFVGLENNINLKNNISINNNILNNNYTNIKEEEEEEEKKKEKNILKKEKRKITQQLVFFGLPTNKKNEKKVVVPDNENFYIFWEMYDKKYDYQKCIKLYAGLSKKDKHAIYDYLPNYIKSTPNKLYRKHPANFLSQRTWENEIILKTNNDTQPMVLNEIDIRELSKTKIIDNSPIILEDDDIEYTTDL